VISITDENLQDDITCSENAIYLKSGALHLQYQVSFSLVRARIFSEQNKMLALEASSE
jgi:hypothetical protein